MSSFCTLLRFEVFKLVASFLVQRVCEHLTLTLRKGSLLPGG